MAFLTKHKVIISLEKIILQIKRAMRLYSSWLGKAKVLDLKLGLGLGNRLN